MAAMPLSASIDLNLSVAVRFTRAKSNISDIPDFPLFAYPLLCTSASHWQKGS